MNILLLAMAFVFMTATLLFTEHTDRSFDTRTLSTGIFAFGMLLRMSVAIVVVVLLACLFSAA